MAGIALPYKWQPVGTYSKEFEVITSLTDFDEPLVPKNVYFAEINTITGTNANDLFILQGYYRENISDSWIRWGSVSNYVNSNPKTKIQFGVGNEIVPIRDIETFQLRLIGNIHGDFAINDINIIFRPKRKWTATDVKTFIRAS